MLFKNYHNRKLLSQKLHCSRHTAGQLIKKYGSTLAKNGAFGDEPVSAQIRENNYIKYHGHYTVLQALIPKIREIMYKSKLTDKIRDDKDQRDLDKWIEKKGLNIKQTHHVKYTNLLDPTTIKYSDGGVVNASIYIPTKVTLKRLGKSDMYDPWSIFGANKGYNLSYQDDDTFHLNISMHTVISKTNWETKKSQKHLAQYCQHHHINVIKQKTAQEVAQRKQELDKTKHQATRLIPKHLITKQLRELNDINDGIMKKNREIMKRSICYVVIKDMNQLPKAIKKLDALLIWAK